MDAAKVDLGLDAIDAELERLEDERDSIGERLAELPPPRTAEGFAVCVKVLRECSPRFWIGAGYDAGEWTDMVAGRLIDVAAQAVSAAPRRPARGETQQERIRRLVASARKAVDEAEALAAELEA
jgi:hypothetical protein